MNIYNTFQEIIELKISDLFQVGGQLTELDTSSIVVEPPRKDVHGDLVTNAALVLAKQIGRTPNEIAKPLVEVLLEYDEVVNVEIAGPGFINITLHNDVWRRVVLEVMKAGLNYGVSDLGCGKKVNIEYVSANPTGPLHIGHCRGAVFGDALANLLEKTGFDVTREYYVNDMGAQLEALARSVYLRYCEALGEDIESIPQGLYPGEYLIDVGRKLVARDKGRWQNVPEDKWLNICAEFGQQEMMRLIRNDLSSLAIQHDVFSSESMLHETGKIQAAFDLLSQRDLIYRGRLDEPKGKKVDDWEPREQDLFRAVQFGDAVDRPMRKLDGSWTYFAADIAYHQDKLERGFEDIIDIWGADHGGYIKRLNAAVTAISEGKGRLDVKICNIVRVLEQGVPVRMSKRAGDFVTLSDVVERVGKDVVRFMMLTRRNDAQLDFDFSLVTERSRDNPVFYVQYAHARICSLMRRMGIEFPDFDPTPTGLLKSDLELLTEPEEFGLIKTVARWPSVMKFSAVAHEPHRIAFYLIELASEFHAFWNRGNDDESLRFIVPDNITLTGARLALAHSVAVIITGGLEIMGVDPVEEML